MKVTTALFERRRSWDSGRQQACKIGNHNLITRRSWRNIGSNCWLGTLDKMKDSCSGSDRRDLIGGIIIGVPNKDVGEADEGNAHHIDDDSTCISALSCSERSREPRYQQRPSQGTTRRPHPFPWAASEDISDDVPHISNEAELMDHSTKSSPTAAADHTYRQLRRSTLVANESVHDGKFKAFGCVSNELAI